jgi:hypothetical protein
MAKEYSLRTDIGSNMNVRIKGINNISFTGDIYLFGIWSGVSTRDISHYLKVTNKLYNKIYGFDSFIGFPKETGQNYEVIFNKGDYSSVKLYNTSPQQTIDIIYKGVGNDKLKLIQGYYSQSLRKSLVKSENMQPASFVDIDCDLYTSTKQVLRFMFGNKLIVPGTIIYFDDWGATLEYQGGESLAWAEIVAKYDVRYKQIYSEGSGLSVMKLFKIE